MFCVRPRCGHGPRSAANSPATSDTNTTQMAMARNLTSRLFMNMPSCSFSTYAIGNPVVVVVVFVSFVIVVAVVVVVGCELGSGAARSATVKGEDCSGCRGGACRSDKDSMSAVDD